MVAETADFPLSGKWWRGFCLCDIVRVLHLDADGSVQRALLQSQFKALISVVGQAENFVKETMI